ncbi:terminase [Corynebacterium phoceense]|uniref:terminase n=1 Tax=Corynebacterium phoceense TaxID=1686286 RepID=UPI00211B800C|nr:terminase [Corynebacterium phoceense]MCQ9345869.1 terminase [Corynebacterium phoceense]
MADTALLEPEAGLLLPGYLIDPDTGAWETLPWPGDPRLPKNDPARLALLPPSLGPQVIRWMEYWLIDHKTGRPFRLTLRQKRYFHLKYAIAPETNRWLYTSSVVRGAKGTGKDPQGAAEGLAELCGPVKLAGWRAGQPVGAPRRFAKVGFAANSLEQAGEMLEVANGMISPQLKAKLRIDTGMTRTIIPSTGSKLELLTASEKTGEGKPNTAVILNETHHMTESSGGMKVAEVAYRNVAKSPKDVQARVSEYTNAHHPGMDSWAERSYSEWQEQVARGRVKMLYDSLEADPRLNIAYEDDLRRGIAQAYRDAPWADLDSIFEAAIDSRTSPAETIRYYLNGLAAAEEAWADPAKFDACSRADITVDEGEKIAMFLDCSKSTDATTLSACRLSDGHVLSLGGWRRPKGARGDEWLAPREVIDAVVREAFDYYKVVWFGVDPSPATDDSTEALYWGPLIDQWHRDYQRKLKVWATPGAGGHSVKFDMRMSQPGAVRRNRTFTEAAMQTAIDIEEGTLTHDGDPMLRAHVHNARRRPNQWGVSLGKINRSSNKLVDYAVTMVGARMGRTLALNSGKTTAHKGSGARLLN